MPKILYIVMLMPLLLVAQGKQLTYEEHTSLHSFNKRPTIKSKIRSQLHNLHTIDEDKAKIIVNTHTAADVKSIDLTHKGRYLIYEIFTKSYFIQINALDGTLIKKEKI